jgi:tetratricopeptide (TPR) repeat protein
MEKPNVHELLQRGIAAAKAAQHKQPSPISEPTQQELKEQARRLLLQVTELDESNVQAWLWLSAVMDDLIDKYTCLETVLSLDPDNQAAQAGLKLLNQQVSTPAYAGAEEIQSGSEGASQATPRQISHAWLEEPYQADEWYWLEGETPAPAPTPSPQPQPQEICPFCHHPIGSMDVTCPHCDLPLVMDCPKCNTLMDVEWPACKHCGYDMGDYRLGSVYFTGLALGYQKYNRLPKALAALQVAEQVSPDQPDLYRQMGEVQAELGQTSTAIITLQKAIRQEPGQVGPYLSLGNVFQREGQWEKAEEVYKQALKVLPKSSASHVALGDLFMQRGQLAKARHYLQRATQLNSRNGLAWVRLGQFYDLANNRPLASQAYRQAVKRLPTDLLEAKHAHDRLQTLNPRFSLEAERGWPELIRRLIGPGLIFVLAAFFNTGWWPGSIQGTEWLAIGLSILGTFLWLSGRSLPQNPLIRLLTGQPDGLEDFLLRPVVAVGGLLLWIMALGILLLPLARFFPGLSPWLRL